MIEYGGALLRKEGRNVKDRFHIRWFIAIAAFVFLVGAALPAYPDEQRGGGRKQWDYFAPKDQEYTNLLYNLEKYHFAKDNFWKSLAEGKYGLAIEDLDYLLRYFPNHPDALLMLGRIAKTTKRFSLPIPYFENALKLFPQHAVTQYRYGEYLVDIGLYEEGIIPLEKAVALDPGMSEAHAALGRAYSKLGKRELSREEAEKARILESKEPVTGKTREKGGDR